MQLFALLTWNEVWVIAFLFFLLILGLSFLQGKLLETWFSHGPNPSGGKIATVYKSSSNQYPWRPIIGLLLGLIGAFYAAYVIFSMAYNELSKQQTQVHIAIWTLAPPLWFFCEWFVLFDNHQDENAVKQFKEGQAAASKLWAAVLIVMLAYQLSAFPK